MLAEKDYQLKIIEEAIDAAWKVFEGNHEKMIRQVIDTVKGSVCLSEHDIAELIPKVLEKMNYLVKNMKEAFSLYKTDFKGRLGFLMREEIKRLVDEKISQLDLGGKDGDQVLE